MTDAELIERLAGSLPKGCRDNLAYWFETNRRFKDFCLFYKNKIRKKIQAPASIEDKDDVFYELEFPYLILLDDRFEVEFEKYGVGGARSPDFTVTFDQHTVFNTEVKRIREGSLGWRYDRCIEQICTEIRAIPSTLHIYINHADTFHFKSDLADRLESRKETLIQFIKQTIHTDEGKLPISSTGGMEYPIPNFEGELFLSISKPPRKANHSETPCFKGFRPIFYTQKEFKKFGDIICDSIKQMRPGEVNLLVISSASTTHERDDLPRAIDSIRELRMPDSHEFFSKKGFRDKEDFTQQFRNVSGILFRSTFSYGTDRNLLWWDGGAAQPIPEPIQHYLKRMDRVRN